MKHFLFIPILFAFSFIACQKDEVPEEPTEATTCGTGNAGQQANVHFPMTIGSYWIYHYYDRDTLGNITPSTIDPDTITVVGDSTWNGHVWMVFEGTAWPNMTTSIWLYRDSANHIVDSNGNTVIGSESVGDTISSNYIQPVGWLHLIADSLSDVNTPAGLFQNCYTRRFDFYPDDTNYPWGIPRTEPVRYAPGVGLVYRELYYYSSPNYILKQLVEYNIAP